MEKGKISVLFDFRCPFSYLFFQYVQRCEKTLKLFNFIPYPLSRSHFESQQSYWREDFKVLGLNALLVANYVRQYSLNQYNELLAQLFSLKFKHFLNVDEEGSLVKAMLDLGMEEKIIKKSQEKTNVDDFKKTVEFYKGTFDVFGVPTLVYHDKAVFVKLQRAPESETRAETVIRQLISLVKDVPELAEFKHTKMEC